MAGLILVNLSLLIYERRRRGKGPFLRGQLIIGSGSGPNVTSNTLNGAALADFRREYKVALVCGLRDDSVDKFEDTRISTSAAFTITANEMEVLIPYQAPMLDVLNASLVRTVEQIEAQRTKPGFRHKRKPKHLLLNYQITTWTETVLLPKSVDPVNIHKLSDVRIHGGKILSEEIEHKRITQTV